MFKNFIKFIKYNNATVLILVIVLIAGTGVFAQTETGQDFIGQKQTKIKGIDNTLLLEINLDNFEMGFEIKEIKKDEKYYYIKYIYYDLIKNNNVWKYQWNEKNKKISLKLKKDLGQYLEEELSEEYQARIKELKQRQEKAKKTGEQKRTEIIDYNGLIGKTLQITGKIFPGYEPVKTKQIPSPEIPTTILIQRKITDENSETTNNQDNLKKIILEATKKITKKDFDVDGILDEDDNCPNDSNPKQEDTDLDGIGDICDCSTNNLDLCDMDGCFKLELYWDDGFCTTTAATTDSTTSTDSSCNISNLGSCDEDGCFELKLYWVDDGFCTTTATTTATTTVTTTSTNSSCDTNNLGSCDEDGCSNLGLFWYNKICNIASSTEQ